MCHLEGEFHCTWEGCHFIATNRLVVTKHRAVHDRFECDLDGCDRRFNQKCKLLNHLQQDHHLQPQELDDNANDDEEEGGNVQDVLETPRKVKLSIKKSKKTTSDAEVKSVKTLSLKCHHCELMFPVRYQLDMHMTQKHSTLPFKCLATNCLCSFETT